MKIWRIYRIIETRSNNNDITWELFTRDERLEAKLAESLGRNQFHVFDAWRDLRGSFQLRYLPYCKLRGA